MFERIKYLAYFSFALVSAFLTFRAFYMFQGEAMLGTVTIFFNTVILMIIWFLSFTSKNEFIRDNRFSMIGIPVAAIHLSNTALHLQTTGTSTEGLLAYIVASSSLVFFSYMASRQEKKI